MDIEPVVSKNYLVKAPFQVKEVSETISAIPPGQYLIELEACGLCHSDLVWMGHRSEDWEKIGHEFGGKVLKAGTGTSKFKEGQRVAVKNAAPCGLCDQCKDGRERYCQNVIVNKSGYDRFFLADERSMVDADGLSDMLLGLVEPLGVANDVVASADIRPGDQVTVYGLGTIGLLAGWLCLQKGATAVYGCARSTRCFEVAGKSGFTECFKTAEKKEMISNKILVFAPPGALDGVMALLKHEGLIVIAGLNEGNWGSSELFNFEKLIFKRASIKGAFGYPNLFFEQAVEQLRANGKILKNIITNVICFNELYQICDRAKEEIKLVFKP